MAITDHVAILAHASLDIPRINRLNPEKPAAFFAQLAFPPEAANDLMALYQAVAPGGNLAGLEIGVKQNGALAKPLPGVPADWFVVRSATQYAPYVADGAGNQLEQSNPAHAATIKTHFYAGKKVRAAISTYSWEHAATRRRGVSFNLNGIMASEDAERLNVGAGVTVNAFKQYADPTKAAGVTPVPGTNARAAGGNNANPFAVAMSGSGAPTASTVQSAGSAASATANPFASAGAPAQSANPFAQPAANNANPFATA